MKNDTTTEGARATITSSLESFRAKANELQGKLDVAILYGQGYMILADTQTTSGPLTMVLGSFDRPGHYAVNAPLSFCSLDIVPNHLCGVSLRAPDRAIASIEAAKKDPALADLSNWRIRHIREEQTRRLKNTREMVAHLEGMLAKL